MIPPYLAEAARVIADFEGRVNWMYLDKEVVAVGCGQDMPNAHWAIQYPFQRPNAEFASEDEIVADYNRVSLMPRGKVAKAYRRSDSLLLSDASIDKIMEGTISGVDVGLSRLFHEYRTFPDAVKIALLDMGYNLGLGKLRREFPKFCEMVENKDWPRAANQCHRIGPDLARNDWTQNQFMNANRIALPDAEPVENTTTA